MISRLQKFEIYALDDRYSTTKFLTHPFDNYLIYDDKGIVTDESKFNINDLKFNIKNSKFIGKPENKFETMLFLPKTNNRLSEGGLRTKGYFKHNYKLYNNEWYIIGSDNKLIEKISLPDSVLKTNINNKQITDIPLVSIVTVVYNGEKYLEETIQSVITQTYPNVEYIIIDGGSTDGTLDIIKKHENVIDYFISEPDKGIYDAMNKGISLILGKWINFLNNKDKILYIDYESLVFLNSTNSCYYLNERDMIKRREPLTKFYLTHNTPCHQSIFYYKNELELYNTDYKIEADFEQMTRVCKKILWPIYSNHCVFFDINGVSGKYVKDKSWKTLLRRMFIINRNLGLFYGFISFLHILRIKIQNYFKIKYKF